MAFDFIKQLHQDAMEKLWNAKPAKLAKDPMPARRLNVTKGIDKALEALKAGESSPKRGMYATKEGVDGVRVQLKYGQRPLTINGRDHWYVGDAPKFFNEAKAACEKGELDEAINNVLEGKDTKATGTRTRAQRSTAGKTMDPEAKYARNVKRYGKEKADELRAKQGY